MAPHWKCGLGQPIAGSNPALSATPARARWTADACVAASGPRSRTLGCARSGPRTPPSPRRPSRGLTFRPWTPDHAREQTTPSRASRRCCSVEFRFPDPELAERVGVVVGYAVRHPGGILLFDTGFGFGNAELGGCLPPGRATDRRGPGRGRHRGRRHHRSRQLPPSRGPRRTERRVSRYPDLRPAGRMGAGPHDRPHDPRVGRLPRRSLRTDRRRPRGRARHPGRRDARATRPDTNPWSSTDPMARPSSPARPSTPPANGRVTRKRSRDGAAPGTRPPTTARSSVCAG